MEMWLMAIFILPWTEYLRSLRLKWPIGLLNELYYYVNFWLILEFFEVWE